jgi:hypothetical protein
MAKRASGTRYKKTNVKTFACLSKPIKLTKDKQKVQAVNIDREIFSRLVVVSESRDIDLKELYSYELAQVPLALANLDGSMIKTSKSMLLKELEIDGKSTMTLPKATHNSAYIIDLLAVVQMLSKGTLATFGDLSDAIGGQILQKYQYANEVHIVPDWYDRKLSITSDERDRRTRGSAVEIRIKSRSTKLPSSLKSYLSNSKNKTNLLTCLVSDWCTEMPAKLTDYQVLYIGTPDGRVEKVTNLGHSTVGS